MQRSGGGILGIPIMAVAFLLMVAVIWLTRNASPFKVDRMFRVGQLICSAAHSIGHGTNDEQKAMDFIALVLCSSGCRGNTFDVRTEVNSFGTRCYRRLSPPPEISIRS